MVVFEGDKNLINTVIEVKIIEDHMWYFKGVMFKDLLKSIEKGKNKW